MATDSNFDKVALLLHGDGANLGTVFTDSSGTPNTPTLLGTPVTSTTVKQWGTASLKFNGTTDALSYVHAAPLALGNNDFTVEAWIYPTSLTTQRTIAQKDQSYGTTYSSFSFAVGTDGSLKATAGTGNAATYQQSFTTAAGLIAINTMSHVAFTRQGTTVKLFVNGALSLTATQTGTAVDGGKPLIIGQYPGGGGTADAWWSGYIDDFRITNGFARYTAAFTPPTAAFPDTGDDVSYVNTALILHADGANLSTTITDTSQTPKTVTAVSGAKISTAQSLFGGASLALNGSTDYATVPAHADFDFGTGDFTIEAAFFFTAFSASFGGSYGAALLANYLSNGAANTGWQLRINGTSASWTTINVYTGLTDLNIAGLSIANNTWNRVAITRAGTQLRMFLNGALVYTVTNSDSFTRSAGSPLYIGQLNDATFRFNLPGYMDEARITKGVARYTAAYTPTYAPFPDVAPPVPPTEHGTAALTLLLPVVAGYGAGTGQTVLPRPVVAGYGAGTGLIALATPVAVGYGPGYANITLSPWRLYATGSTLALNTADITVGSFAAVGYGAGSIKVALPAFALSASGSSPILGTAALTLPNFAVAASGTATTQGYANVTIPGLFAASGYGAGTASATLPLPTVAASGTATVRGSASITLPIFQLIATGSVGSVGSANITLPNFILAPTGRAVITIPNFIVVALGSAVVVRTAAGYEAYALNLSHDALQAKEQVMDEVTRYSYFPFTQIVRFGTDYYGIGLDGVYKIGGTTDAGLPIQWAIRTGETDFGSPQKKVVLAAYLSGRLGPNMVMTSRAGEKAAGVVVHTYSNPRTSAVQNYRQKFGRGAKARYFSLDLTDTTGGDLLIDELDLEVMPLERKI